jgi:TonB family protein
MLMLVPDRLDRVAQRRLRSVYVAGLLLALFSFCFVQAVAMQELSRKVIAKTVPSIPELARKMHLTGKVKVEIVINPAGSVTSARLVGGNPVFEKNAVDAVKQWKFEAAQKETKAVILLEFADQ